MELPSVLCVSLVKTGTLKDVVRIITVSRVEVIFLNFFIHIYSLSFRKL